jgi:hypothetical protein
VFLWRPSADWRSWDLEWHLFEVVRDDLIRVDNLNPIVTLQAARPPGPRSFEVGAYAEVRRLANGDAEWAVLKGPRAGTGIIPQAKRQDVR